MSNETLSRDATIADVVGTLRNPEEYVRRVLENMLACKKEKGRAGVRIGITGQGKAPHYRVDPTTFVDVLLEHATPPFGAYNGTSHKEFISDDVIQEVHWSGKAMTTEEVQELLRKLRQFRRRSSSRA